MLNYRSLHLTTTTTATATATATATTTTTTTVKYAQNTLFLATGNILTYLAFEIMFYCTKS